MGTWKSAAEGKQLRVVLTAFFVLAALVLLNVALAAPAVVTSTVTSDLETTISAIGVTIFVPIILLFICLLLVGTWRRWRWVFWLVLIAFSFSPLEILANLLQLAGVIPLAIPVWYALLRVASASAQMVIALWMWRIYHRAGTWGSATRT